MPKYDHLLNPGDELPKEWKDFLKTKFSDKDFEKLSKFGGRIQVSITAPFSNRKEHNKDIILDNEFIQKLKSQPENSGAIIKSLTKKQLTELAKMIQFPVTQKSSTKEIKNSIIDFFDSAEKWSRISKV
jgi:hypothetical protein